MDRNQDIPCASCRSWNRKRKKFSCKPNDCKELNLWFSQNAPQLSEDFTEMQVRIPEPIRYVV